MLADLLRQHTDLVMVCALLFVGGVYVGWHLASACRTAKAAEKKGFVVSWPTNEPAPVAISQPSRVGPRDALLFGFLVGNEAAPDARVEARDACSIS
jgi:hypothetical protein